MITRHHMGGGYLPTCSKLSHGHAGWWLWASIPWRRPGTMSQIESSRTAHFPSCQLFFNWYFYLWQTDNHMEPIMRLLSNRQTEGRMTLCILLLGEKPLQVTPTVAFKKGNLQNIYFESFVKILHASARHSGKRNSFILQYLWSLRDFWHVCPL